MWRNILFGRDLLLHGVSGGIGNGKSVKITSDHWIPQRPPYMLSPLKTIPEIATALNCLIDEETGSWISETFYEFFDQEMEDLVARSYKIYPMCFT
jgi:hypothetical protein